MRWNRTVLGIVFYGGLTAVLLGIWFEIFPMFLPAAVADRIGHNSEGVLLTLLLALWIQYARTNLFGSSREWPLTSAAASACLAIAIFLLLTDLPSRFRTLNETFLAATVLIPYVQVRRPLPSNLATWLSVAMLVTIVFSQRTQIGTDLAESLGVLVLAPIGFDIVDRGILDPEAPTSTRLRYAWYVTLVVTPIAFSLLEYRLDLSGAAGEVTRYAVRIAEAFLFMLLVEMYLAVGLGRTGVYRSGVVRPEVSGSRRP